MIERGSKRSARLREGSMIRAFCAALSLFAVLHAPAMAGPLRGDCIKAYHHSDNSTELGNQCHFRLNVAYCIRNDQHPCSCSGSPCRITLNGFQDRKKVTGNDPSGRSTPRGGSVWVRARHRNA